MKIHPNTIFFENSFETKPTLPGLLKITGPVICAHMMGDMMDIFVKLINFFLRMILYQST